MELLSEEAIEKTTKDFPEWKLVEEKWLERDYHFKKYLSAIDFVQKVANYAQKKMHHPIIKIDHTTVTLSISSIEMDGLTELDIEMIERFDKIFSMSEK